MCKRINEAVTYMFVILLIFNITSAYADGKRLTSDFEVPIGLPI